MLDLLYIAVTILFFALAGAYVRGCDRLAPVSRTTAPSDRGSA